MSSILATSPPLASMATSVGSVATSSGSSRFGSSDIAPASAAGAAAAVASPEAPTCIGAGVPGAAARPGVAGAA
eukprot:9017786-Pyramimonas_sp.AAC.1